jgi:hypothetical protein
MDLKSVLSSVKKDSITIYIFRGATERKKLYLSSFALKTIGLLGIFFIACFIFLVVSVVHLRMSTSAIRSQLSALEMASNQQIRGVEIPPVSLRSDSESNTSSLPAKAEAATSPFPVPEIQSRQLEIRDFLASPAGTESEINVSFEVANLGQERKINGYISVFGFPADFDLRSCSAYPDSLKLQQDYSLPSSQRGEFFSIQWFKSIRASLKNPSPDKKIAHIMIVASSATDEILLRKIMSL